ncbi:cutinase family protein [Leucobacter denitrificans]|uniref:cutinase family protein n=1 Tax=Leucobacter denitrificans TaxID=683042 RepID=UPI001FE9B58E|nr:cutinase family protein [Leucobacter denitrificans]
MTEDATPPEADSTYDADLHPEPIVDSLECTRILIITARGTGEPGKRQLLGPVVRAIAEARPDQTQQLDLDYPADTDVKEGGTYGARLLIDTLNVQAEACPEQEFVLLGYSQGALVIGDALSAPEFRLVGTRVGEVGHEAESRIRAIVFYGNPRFMGTEEYDSGSYTEWVNGLLPRPEGSLNTYADRIRDYCVINDFVCQRSLELEDEGHVAYYENGMQQDGASFVISLLPPIDGAFGEKPDEVDELVP